jgi:hypothetical protein
MEFRIIESRHSDQGPRYADTPPVFQAFYPSQVNETCRICLTDDHDTEEDNPEGLLVSPCKCKGTSQYVHLGCLKRWLRSRMIVKEAPASITYSWMKVGCEVCQEPIPRAFRIGDTLYDFVEMDLSFSEPYIILESDLKDKKNGRQIHVLKIKRDECVKLGRGHQCEMRISDISVSRLHALIRYENDQFLLIDNNSKFGTLVLMTEPYPIGEEKMAVQIGRTVLTCTLKPFLPPSTIIPTKPVRAPFTAATKHHRETQVINEMEQKDQSSEIGTNQPSMIMEKEEDGQERVRGEHASWKAQTEPELLIPQAGMEDEHAGRIFPGLKSYPTQVDKEASVRSDEQAQFPVTSPDALELQNSVE